MNKVPSALAHRRAGTPHGGRMRYAGGLLLQGVVIKVHGVAAPSLASIRNPTNLNQPTITCDVFVYDPKHTTILYDVPIMRESAGLVDNDVWIPRAASIDLISGVMNVGNAPPPAAPLPMSEPKNLDGDHVVIGFLSNDLSRPVILGQLDHPRNVRNLPTDTALYKRIKYVRGWKIGVTGSGNIDINGVLAGSGIVPPGLPPVETPAVPVAGNINVAFAAGAKASLGLALAPSPTQEPVVLGTTFLTSLQAKLTAEKAAWDTLFATHTAYATAFTALGQPAAATAATAAANAAVAASVQIATVLSSITTSLGAGKPFLSTVLETD